jgi:hypothetical protein
MENHLASRLSFIMVVEFGGRLLHCCRINNNITLAGWCASHFAGGMLSWKTVRTLRCRHHAGVVWHTQSIFNMKTDGLTDYDDGTRPTKLVLLAEERTEPVVTGR